ncbi:MAG: hypothetical protein RSE36_08280 [Oscillospiraceae bacterium]
MQKQAADYGNQLLFKKSKVLFAKKAPLCIRNGCCALNFSGGFKEKL